MKRIRVWLIGLGMLAIVTAGSAGWPDTVEGPGSAVVGPLSAVVGSSPQPGLTGRGQRW